MPLRKQARDWPHDPAKLRHASLAGGPIILRKGWPHDPAKLLRDWPHGAANRHRRNFVGQHFWARGFFVSTVGRDEGTIRNYIKHQEKEDERLEQLRLIK
jgi:hypothetical protein